MLLSPPLATPSRDNLINPLTAGQTDTNPFQLPPSPGPSSLLPSSSSKDSLLSAGSVSTSALDALLAKLAEFTEVDRKTLDGEVEPSHADSADGDASSTSEIYAAWLEQHRELFIPLHRMSSADMRVVFGFAGDLWREVAQKFIDVGCEVDW